MISRFSSFIKKLLEKETNSIDAVDELAILPPRKPTDLTKLIGAFKSKMTVEEIDSLTQSWRNEWQRDFS